MVRRLDKEFEQRFLRVQTVFGLIPCHGARVVQQVEADFFAAVSRQAVHEKHVVGSKVEQGAVDLIRGEQLQTLGGFFLLAH